jgi:hypothetical protein
MRIVATWTELPFLVSWTAFAALGIVMLPCSRNTLAGCRIHIYATELLATLKAPGPTTARADCESLIIGL